MNIRPRIGLALGSGSSRGWSHIGVIEALAEMDIHPDIVCGTSVGAMVGAAYVNQRLPGLRDWATSVTRLDVARFLDINTSFKGFVNTRHFHEFLNENIADDDLSIESLPKRFATVATDLFSGKEIWFQQGSVVQAVWSSMALPGLFPAIHYDGSWVVDGGLVNPVPVSTCRALGADTVIAVNLNGDIVGKHIEPEQAEPAEDSVSYRLSELVREYTDLDLFSNHKEEQAPGLLDAIAASVNITQDRITRSRLAGDPPDLILSPRLSDIGLLELYRAEEAIAEGRDCVERMAAEIEYLREGLCS